MLSSVGDAPSDLEALQSLAAALTADDGAREELLQTLPDRALHELAAAVRDELAQRAIDFGDHDAILERAFETGFGRDGLATRPWVSEHVVVCPGGLVGKSRASHRCRFVSVNDTWIWECPELIREEKRSTPGTGHGFRAVALLPVIEGMGLDLVSGRLKQGQHRVDKVISFEVRRGELVEVAQRDVSSFGMA